MTRNGIEYNLNITPYIYEINYDDIIITYRFSSETYLKKFEDYKKDLNYIKREQIKHYKKYGFKFYIEHLEDLKNYNSIEKRGFNILIDGEKFTDIEDIDLNFTISLKRGE